MADSPLDIAAEINASLSAIEKNVKAAKKTVAQEGAKVSREELRSTAAGAAGADRRFSRFNGPALDVAARYDIDGVTIVPKGPWKIAEEGADPHKIGSGMHPGTRAKQGRRAWTRGRDAAIRRVDQKVQDILHDAVEDGFRA